MDLVTPNNPQATARADAPGSSSDRFGAASDLCARTVPGYVLRQSATITAPRQTGWSVAVPSPDAGFANSGMTPDENFIDLKRHYCDEAVSFQHDFQRKIQDRPDCTESLILPE